LKNYRRLLSLIFVIRFFNFDIFYLIGGFILYKRTMFITSSARAKFNMAAVV